MRKVHCAACCSRCGKHFTGDRAFDLHKRGDYEVTDEKGRVLSENTRHCDVENLELRTIEGVCSVGRRYHPDGPQTVEVWGERTTAATRERFERLRHQQARTAIPAAA